MSSYLLAKEPGKGFALGALQAVVPGNRRVPSRECEGWVTRAKLVRVVRRFKANLIDRKSTLVVIQGWLGAVPKTWPRKVLEELTGIGLRIHTLSREDQANTNGLSPLDIVKLSWVILARDVIIDTEIPGSLGEKDTKDPQEVTYRYEFVSCLFLSILQDLYQHDSYWAQEGNAGGLTVELGWLASDRPKTVARERGAGEANKEERDNEDKEEEKEEDPASLFVAPTRVTEDSKLSEPDEIKSPSSKEGRKKRKRQSRGKKQEEQPGTHKSPRADEDIKPQILKTKGDTAPAHPSTHEDPGTRPVRLEVGEAHADARLLAYGIQGIRQRDVTPPGWSIPSPDEASTSDEPLADEQEPPRKLGGTLIVPSPEKRKAAVEAERKAHSDRLIKNLNLVRRKAGSKPVVKPAPRPCNIFQEDDGDDEDPIDTSAPKAENRAQ